MSHEVSGVARILLRSITALPHATEKEKEVFCCSFLLLRRPFEHGKGKAIHVPSFLKAVLCARCGAPRSFLFKGDTRRGVAAAVKSERDQEHFLIVGALIDSRLP